MAAVSFCDHVGFVHSLLFFGELSVNYDASIFTPTSPSGIGVTFVPVVAGLGVAFLVSRFAHEARGSGVGEVMDFDLLRDGGIRPVVAVVKSLASALSTGSGAAVGREGPIVQVLPGAP